LDACSREAGDESLDVLFPPGIITEEEYPREGNVHNEWFFDYSFLLKAAPEIPWPRASE
jgi:hypothetical protein